MIEHFPALQVVTPLIAAPLCVLLHRGRAAWVLALVVSWLCFGISLHMLVSVLETGEMLGYTMGGWAAPFGIEYRVDTVNAFVLVIVSGASALLLIAAKASVEQEVEHERIYLFYGLWLLNLTGLLGIAITADAFNVFVFLEISSLSTYALIALGKSRRVVVAAFRYLVIGTIGATFILIGIGLLYMVTGTLNMADLADRVANITDSRVVQAALGFLAVGIAIKMAVFPLHSWLPDSYTYAPSIVSAYLAATATKVGIYMWLRIYFSIFGVELVFEQLHIDKVLMVVALAAIVLMSVVALYQTDVKRMLAFSSVAQIGYMVLGISYASVSGLTGTLVHLFNHALMKSALFLALACVVYRVGTAQLGALQGIGRQMPWTLAAFVVAGFSLIGVPLTAGFISKWYLLVASLEVDSLFGAFVIVGASLTAFGYIWRLVDVMVLKPAPAGSGPVREAPASMLIVLWVLVAANLYFGVDADTTLEVAGQAARTLLDSRFTMLGEEG